MEEGNQSQLRVEEERAKGKVRIWRKVFNLSGEWRRKERKMEGKDMEEGDQSQLRGEEEREKGKVRIWRKVFNLS